MKKYFQTALIAFFAAAALVSCKKEDVTAPVVTAEVTKKVKTIKDLTGFKTYQYDGQDRISSVEDDFSTENFDYSKGKVIITQSRTDDHKLLVTKECVLNNQGAIVSMELKYPNNVHAGCNYHFVYNADGLMEKITTDADNVHYEENFEILNGNVTGSKSFFNGGFTGSKKFTYDISQVNKMPFSSQFIYPSVELFGKSSKNAVIGLKEFDDKNQLRWEVNYANETDAEGYLKKVEASYVFLGYQEEYLYTFY